MTYKKNMMSVGYGCTFTPDNIYSPKGWTFTPKSAGYQRWHESLSTLCEERVWVCQWRLVPK